MASIVVMRCPDCTFEKEIKDGEEYSQADLHCPNDNAELVVKETRQDDSPPPTLPPAPTPPLPEVPPLELLTKQMERIQELYRAVRTAQSVHDSAKEDLKDAKEELERRKAALLVYIGDCRTPTILPLFDQTAPAEQGAEEINELRLKLGEMGVDVDAPSEEQGEAEDAVIEDELA